MTFETTSQRVLFSYQRQLSEFVPVLPENLSPDEQDELQTSQKELDAFFHAFYQRAYDHPKTFGLPLIEDVYIAEGDGKEEKQNVTKQTRNSRSRL